MNMSVQSRKQQSGFTLIEIAIVLVIIGLLLGGVLQGQQLIQNSRVKAATNDFNGIVTAMLSYRDRYGKLPGDDGELDALQARGGAWANVTAAGDGDGILDAAVGDTFSTEENLTSEGGYTIFQHLRAAGFITGDAGARTLPQNPFGGFIGVTTAPILGSGGTGSVQTMSGVKVCMSSVNGTAVLALDTQLDDGVTNTGRFRASLDTDGRTPPRAEALPNADAVDENEIYTVCFRAF